MAEIRILMVGRVHSEIRILRVGRVSSNLLYQLLNLMLNFTHSYRCSLHAVYTLGHSLARDFRQRKTVFHAIVVGRWSVFGFHFLCMPSAVHMILFRV